MIKKTAFVFLFLLISFSVVFPSGFFNIGDSDGSTGVFFGTAYVNGWRDIYLGEQDTILYSLRYINYDGFLGINISDYFAVYGIFGMDEFQFEENLDGDYNFKIGGGMRIKLIEFVMILFISDFFLISICEPNWRTAG